METSGIGHAQRLACYMKSRRMVVMKLVLGMPAYWERLSKSTSHSLRVRREHGHDLHRGSVLRLLLSTYLEIPKLRHHFMDQVRKTQGGVD